VPLDHYFAGWINKYEIACSYAQQGEMSLDTPVRKAGSFDIQGLGKDIARGNGFSVVLDSTQGVHVFGDNPTQAFGIQRFTTGDSNDNDDDLNCQRVAILDSTLSITDSNQVFLYCTTSTTQVIQRH